MTGVAFDLQSHSTVSDGALAPSEVVAAAGQAGMQLLALTDHDAVDGVPEAVAAGRRDGVRVVPALELSVVDAGRQDLHVCGYLVDPEHPELAATLRACRADRALRADRMAAALRACGLRVDLAPLQARSAIGAAVGRPHLAQAVWEHPANAAQMRDEGLCGPSAVLEAYLIPGRPAFVPRPAPTVQEGIDLIHAAGGVAVWAHPFWDVEDEDAVGGAVDRFAAMGLDGVEAFYVTHTERQTRVAAGHAARHGLLTTGSADYHGPDHRHFSRFGAFDTFDLTPELGPIAAA